MAKKFKVLVNTGKAENNESFDVTQGQGMRGQPLRIKAQTGAKYQLQDLEKAQGVAPQYVKVKRMGKNLHLMFEESQEADVIIEDYYEVMPNGSNSVLGQAENGSFYEFIPEDPNVKGLISELADGGQVVSMALGGSEVLGSGAAVGLLAVNPLLGALGLAGAGAGAAVLGAVAAAGTGPGTGTGPGPGTAKPISNVAISLNPIAGDNILSVAEGNQATTTLNGKVTGAFSAGDIVTLNLNGKTLSTTVAADGNYSFTLSTFDIKTDSDTKAEVSIAAKDPVTGNITTVTNSQDYTVETQTTANKSVALYIDPVTLDNLINSAEAGAANTAITGKVTGVFTAGDFVDLSLNGKIYRVAVNAQGAFNISLPTSELLADPDKQIEGSVTTSAGAANAVQNFGVDTSPPVATVTLDKLTADNLINATEAGQLSLPVTGKLTGEFQPGDVVTVAVNGKPFTGSVKADGRFSVDVPTAELIADPDTQYEVSVALNDGAGNTGTSTAVNDYDSSVKPPSENKVSITLDPVAGDNILSVTEGNQATTTLSGKVTGPFTAGDIVTLSLNNKTLTTTVATNGAYSFIVSTSDIKADSDTKAEVSVAAKDPVTGKTNTATNSQDYAIETMTGTGTALVVNPVTADNLINKVEAQSTTTAVIGKVTGVFAVGDKVTLQINDKTFTAAVDAQGNFSVSVPTTDLLADADTQINASVTATTPGGSVTANAVQNYGVDITPPVASMKVDNITPDNLISAQEAGQASLPVTGKVTGEFRPGDVVTVSVNDKTFTAAVDAQGTFSVNVPTVDLLADPDTKLQVSVVVTDGAGNTGNATNEVDYNVQGNPPVNTVPGAQTTLEDTNKVITGLQVSDADAGNSTMTVTLSVTNGMLTLLTSNGVNIATNNTASVQLTGTLGAINTLLATANAVTYKPLTNFSGSATLTMSSSDGTFSDLDTVAMTINAVNDAPTGTSKTITLLKNSSKTFSSADFGFADALDMPANTLSAVIITSLPSAGTLKLNGQNVFEGQVISAANLGNLVYAPVPNANGVGYAAIGFKVQDNGGTANAGSDTSTTANTLTFNVTDANPFTVLINEPVLQNANGTLTVSGTGLIGSLITVTGFNNVVVGTATVQGNGTWTLTSAGPVMEGTLTANASLNGDSATDTAPYVDDKPPVVSIIEPVTQNADGTLTVKGTSEPGAKIQVTGFAGVLVGTTTVLPDGTWSVKSTVPVKQGELTATATDINMEVATDTAPYADNKPPAVQIKEPVVQNTNGTLTVEGTSEPGATIVVKDVNNAIIGTTTVLVNGTWKLISTAAVPYGTLTASATDINGQAGTDTAPYADNTPPAPPVFTATDPDANGKINASGTAEPGAKVTVTWPDNSTSTTTAGPNGAWTVESPTVQLSGTVKATATDAASNTSDPATATYTDTTKPAAPTVTATDPDANGKINASGTAEPGAKVTVTWPDNSTSTTTAGPNGAWTVESPTVQLSGTVKATVTDAASNTSDPATATYTDSTPPAVQIKEPVVQKTNGTLTVEGTSEPGATIVVKDVNNAIIGTTTVLGNGTWTLTSTKPVPEGTLSATATDINGKTGSDTAPYNDTTAPAVAINEPVVQNPNGTLTVSGTGEPGATVVVTGPAPGNTPLGTATVQPNGTWTLTSLGTVPFGTLTATATDINGKFATDTAPYVQGLAISNLDVKDTDGDGKPTISGQVNKPNQLVTITDPTGATHTVTTGPDGKFSLELDPEPNPLTGTYTATAVSGTDTATQSVIETDLTAPVITNLDAKDTDGDGKPTVSGVVDTPNAVVTITDPAGVTHTVTAGPDGKFSLELDPAPSPLLGTYSAKAVDAAGNTSLPVSVTETDLTAPLVTNVSVGDSDGNGKPTVSGQTEPNLVVTITDPAGVTHTVTAGPNGVFSLEINPAPSPLIGTYGVTAVDPAGNTSAPVTAQLGAAIPVLIIEPVTQNPNGTITVTGTGEQGAKIEVKDVNNVLVGTATVLPNGTWSLNSAGEVPAGQLTATSTNLNQQITTDTALYNNTPVAVLDVAQGTEDSTTLTGNVSTNDTHKDGTETYELMSSATGSHGGLVFNPLNGAWTYTRTANLNAIQTAAIDTFTYKVKDAAGKESTAQLKIILDPVNDAPKVTYSTVEYATYFENAEPVAAISAPLVLSDVDSANLRGATVRVGAFSSPNAFMPGDLLSFNLPANSPIRGEYDTNTGILTFTGVASVAQYQDALSSVKYAHNKDDYAADGNRKVFWTVTDEGGLASSNPPFSWIVVKKLNDAPGLTDTNLALPSIQPLSTASLPTDASKYGLGITTSLLVGGMSDADGPGVTKGIAIVGVNTSMGTLYLSSDGGETWATPGFEVSSSNAILLRSQGNRRVYFQPHVGVEGTIADAVTIRAWDTSNNVVESVNGLQVQGYPITTVGGTSPYSSTTDTVSLTVATLASAPAYNGTVGDDVINGSVGPDVIVAKGGIDQINAGDGHDKIVINASNVQSLSAQNSANLDGGTGINTLKLTAAYIFLDLTQVTAQSKVNNFSVLDITGDGANTLKINQANVETMSGAENNPNTAAVDESKMLVVQANQGDAVVLEKTSNWASLSGLSGDSLTTLYGAEYGFIANHKYTQFSKNGATLFVDELAPVADIVGTSANDTLTGTDNADVIYGNGGVDSIAAGAGKDTVILTASSLTALAANTNMAKINGGTGIGIDINTLKLSGINLNLDLTNATVMGKLDNFNVIDMKQGSGNKFTLSLSDVLALAGGTDNAATAGVDESKMLVLQGNGGAAFNTLQLKDGLTWTAVTNLGGTGLLNTYGADFGFEAGRSYTQYSSGSANLFVDESLLRNMV